jgi:hypothetical protein
MRGTRPLRRWREPGCDAVIRRFMTIVKTQPCPEQTSIGVV